MGRGYRRFNNTYPEEREENAKDSNKKLKAEIKHLRKVIKNLESENKTLSRAFDKSSDFINQKLSDKTIEQIIEMVNDFEEKKKEQEKVLKEKQETKRKQEAEKNKTCPDCFADQDGGFRIVDFKTFKVHMCGCGFRTRVNVEK